MDKAGRSELRCMNGLRPETIGSFFYFLINAEVFEWNESPSYYRSTPQTIIHSLLDLFGLDAAMDSEPAAEPVSDRSLE